MRNMFEVLQTKKAQDDLKDDLTSQQKGTKGQIRKAIAL